MAFLQQILASVGAALSGVAAGWSFTRGLLDMNFTNIMQAQVCVSSPSGMSVVVSDYGAVSTSTDGETWTPNTSLQSTLWGLYMSASCGYYGGGRFIISSSLGHIATSPDGVSWTYNGSLITSTGWGANDVRALCYDGIKIIASGPSGRVAIATV